MNDFICTNAVSYYVENDVLNAVVQMRSNDAVYGYKNDLAWQKEVLRMLASDLEMEPGKIIWQVQNLHVYERHYDYLET
jgi:thymidylate synthase